MIALTIFAIALSIGAIALCVWTDFQHYEDDKATCELIKQHTEIMRHITNCIGLLEQRIKKLEEDKNHEERN